MSFQSISQNAADQAFVQRVNGCAAKEGENPPADAAQARLWAICAAGDIEAAYESALAGGNPNPGGDPSVITDAMILSAYQAAPVP